LFTRRARENTTDPRRLFAARLRRRCDEALRRRGLLAWQFAKDRVRANRGVLAVWAGLAVGRQSVFEVEDDDGVSRPLQEEVAERADGERVRRAQFLVAREVCVLLLDLFESVLFEAVNQIVGLHAEAATPAHLDERTRALLRAQL